MITHDNYSLRRAALKLLWLSEEYIIDPWETVQYFASIIYNLAVCMKTKTVIKCLPGLC